MRITGGLAKGIRLHAPPGIEVRPATDRLREAVFSSLGLLVEGARVIDLFAGSGAYGLEALSRRAAGLLAVEQDRRAVGCWRRNLASVERAIAAAQTGAAPSPATLREQNVFALDEAWAGFAGCDGCDVIFADPPYALLQTHADALLERTARWTCTGGRLVLESPGSVTPRETAAWRVLKRLGKAQPRAPGVWILERTDAT